MGEPRLAFDDSQRFQLGDDAREDEYGEGLSAEAMVRQAKQMVAKYGFKEIKMKGGVLDPDEEIEQEYVIKALDACRRVGLYEVAFRVPEPPPLPK